MHKPEPRIFRTHYLSNKSAISEDRLDDPNFEFNFLSLSIETLRERSRVFIPQSRIRRILTYSPWAYRAAPSSRQNT
jgi:hypothetical protein